MSRRCHHGSPRHAGRPVARPVRRAGGVADAVPPGLIPGAVPPSVAPPGPTLSDRAGAGVPDEARFEEPPRIGEPDPNVTVEPEHAPEPIARPAARPAPPAFRGSHPMAATREPSGTPAPAPDAGAEAGLERGATAPQLRRFIKSRAYVPMHELRRRFAIDGGEDDVTVVEVDRKTVYVGLPEREGRLLGELLRGGDIGFELSMDPVTPVVVGVYPMRPVSRG
jgi:hypothetical protein